MSDEVVAYSNLAQERHDRCRLLSSAVVRRRPLVLSTSSRLKVILRNTQLVKRRLQKKCVRSLNSRPAGWILDPLTTKWRKLMW